VNDVTQAKALIEEIMPGSVSEDKAYDSDDLLIYIAEKRAKAVIPPRANRKEQREFDRDHYRNRNIIVENYRIVKNALASSTYLTTVAFQPQECCRDG